MPRKMRFLTKLREKYEAIKEKREEKRIEVREVQLETRLKRIEKLEVKLKKKEKQFKKIKISRPSAKQIGSPRGIITDSIFMPKATRKKFRKTKIPDVIGFDAMGKMRGGILG